MGYGNDGFDFEDDERENQGPKALRDALKAANKRVAELEEANGKLSGQVAQRNLKDVLEDKGLRPGLARVITKDGVDASDPQAITDWLTDPVNQEDFAFSLESGDGGSSNEAKDGETDEVDPIEAEFARMQNAGANALPNGKFNEAKALLDAADANDPNAIQAALDRALK